MNRDGVLELERVGQVATIKMAPMEEVVETDGAGDIHYVLGEVLDELRWDDEIRVVVLTGERDGEFLVAPPTDHYGSPAQRRRMKSMRATWSGSQGVVRTHQALALIEKPVIARLNGDAIGFGQSVMFACDLIIARAGARVSDVHLGMGEVTRSSDGRHVGPRFGLVPGDGAAVWVPASMPPQKQKEYLMLSRVLTAEQLADLNIVNQVVPLEQLDGAVDKIVGELLSKPAQVLAMTKRLLNRDLVTRLHQTLEIALAYEKLNFHQLSRNGWKDDFALQAPLAP